MAAQFLRHRLHLAGRDALHVHLDQRRHQCLLRTLVALKQLRREPASPILRNAKLQHPDPRHQLALVIAGPVTRPLRRPLPFLGPDRLRHLGFKNLLHDTLQCWRKPSSSDNSNAFNSPLLSLTSRSVMALPLPRESVIATSPPCHGRSPLRASAVLSPKLFAEPSAHYRIRQLFFCYSTEWLARRQTMIGCVYGGSF